MSLNSETIAKKSIDQGDKDLIAEFIKKKGIQVIAPSGLSGNEACLATRDAISASRRAFRAKMRGKTL